MNRFVCYFKPGSIVLPIQKSLLPCQARRQLEKSEHMLLYQCEETNNKQALTDHRQVLGYALINKQDRYLKYDLNLAFL